MIKIIISIKHFINTLIFYMFQFYKAFPHTLQKLEFARKVNDGRVFMIPIFHL